MSQIATKQIRQLSAGVINKIAAGEVIERPASVVKELLENSVDAGATQIEVTLEQGGTELIRITDKGHGIAPEQLELAVTSHATSKIGDADDLFRVQTFGFRGEALASIAEVSQMLIRSRTADENSAFELRINGGHREPVIPCGAPVGTTMEVRQLFYNTPVRRKFLRTSQTEKGHIAEAFTRVALAHPEIRMTLINNGKTLHNLPPTESWRERIDGFFGAEISDNLIAVNSTVPTPDGDVSINGYVVDPSVSRSHNRMQYLFLNGRYIRDKSLQHALRESYRGLLMVGRFPVCFLRLSMPFELVDVNVHPAKLEVRFQNGGELYRQLLSTLRSKFLSTDLTASARLSRDRNQAPAPAATVTTNVVPAAAPAPDQQEKIEFNSPAPSMDWTSGPREAFSQHLQSLERTAPATPASDIRFPGDEAPVHSAPATSHDFGTQGIGTQGIGTQGIGTQDFGTQGIETHGSGSQDPASGASELENHHAAHPGQARPLALQVHNTYLIQETAEGMLVIDQHALHERIIYEQLRTKVLKQSLETQKLLVPEPVTLPPAECAAVLEQAETLQRIGIVVEPFGGDTVIVSAYPAMLANHNPAEMLRDVIDSLMDDGAQVDRRDLVDELLHMISCKAAVKAGDKLTPEEIDALLQHRDLCQDSHHCPHGRPTSLMFSREELDRRFGRI
ncbi:MAG: DNA mismatch repair endonuclease MutL [Planctomycetota bacterium]